MLTFDDFGGSAVLVASPGGEELYDLASDLRNITDIGLSNVVAVNNQMLVVFDTDQTTRDAVIGGILGAATASKNSAYDPKTVEIDLTFDGEDLGEILSSTKSTFEEFSSIMYSSTFTVSHLGFAPGFVYLSGLDEKFSTPRRTSSRTLVPAGAIAIGGPYLGIYSIPTPGGWNLIGTTTSRLFDFSLEEPIRLNRGDKIKFSPPKTTIRTVSDRNQSPDPNRSTNVAVIPDRVPHLRVLAVSGRVLFEDLGRDGYAHLGIGTSGAMDQDAHCLASIAVGNSPLSATIELAIGTLTIEVLQNTYIAVSGAGTEITIDGHPVRHNRVHGVLRGQKVSIRSNHTGIYSYLAMRGGFDAPIILGSRSTDTLSGIGPPSIDPGLLLYPAQPSQSPADEIIEPITVENSFGVVITQNRDNFDNKGLEWFFTTQFEVSTLISRTGIRLECQTRPVANYRQLEASLPLTYGAIQLPPSGLPIIIGRDHPTTGGYPIIGCIAKSVLGTIAQLMPGSPITFHTTTPEQAASQDKAEQRSIHQRVKGHRPLDEIILITKSQCR